MEPHFPKCTRTVAPARRELSFCLKKRKLHSISVQRSGRFGQEICNETVHSSLSTVCFLVKWRRGIVAGRIYCAIAAELSCPFVNEKCRLLSAIGVNAEKNTKWRSNSIGCDSSPTKPLAGRHRKTSNPDYILLWHYFSPSFAETGCLNEERFA